MMFPSLGIVSWKEEKLSDLAARILKVNPASNPSKIIVLVDGKGGSGNVK